MTPDEVTTEELGAELREVARDDATDPAHFVEWAERLES